MDATTALRCLTHRAERAFKADEEARTRLADELGRGAVIDLSMAIDAALVSSANAKPWRQLMQRIERHGVREGLAKQKAEALESLLSYGMSMSTSLVANAARLAEQEGLRRFLNAVDTLDVDEDDVPAADERTEAGKATPSQERVVLEAIRRNGVTLQEDGVKVEVGSCPRRSMVQYAIDMGWAVVDTSGDLRGGQAVTLTSLGEENLAG
ncbi:hypothetical protein HUT18_11705 [Streptomyces sp. NA04227]|uniref:hypothetical protein n=1 Tax=Streptomyces sp. NA04227 TaxID=2742136 RepID=UPI0015925156|nr:hypothetical protein [Streptomyces sp. NA04227]QKW06963.1 hypothetical protein HUT18_11705 [Streptomyces sp. NA04227]